MNDERGSVERHIIEAAIECIETYGIQGATVQRIAEGAGVNNAAINYYFRSKDQLIQEALDVTLGNAFDWEDFKESEDMPARERLIHILTTLMRDSHQYPGLARAHFSDTVTGADYDTTAIRRLNGFLGELEADLQKRGVGIHGAELKMALTQIMGCAFLLGMLVPGLFTVYSGIDLTDETAGELFVRRLVEGLL